MWASANGSGHMLLSWSRNSNWPCDSTDCLEMDNKHCLVAESGIDSIHKQVMNTNLSIIDGDRVRVTSRMTPQGVLSSSVWERKNCTKPDSEYSYSTHKTLDVAWIKFLSVLCHQGYEMVSQRAIFSEDALDVLWQFLMNMEFNILERSLQVLTTLETYLVTARRKDYMNQSYSFIYSTFPWYTAKMLPLNNGSFEVVHSTDRLYFSTISICMAS